MESHHSESILFLGTAGARVMVSKQLLASGGAWLDLDGTQILVDPGPGCLVHAVRRRLDPAKLRAIILSHKHLDHSGDVNVMIEAMTEGGHRKRGVLFAPSDALHRDKDPVVLRYLQAWPEAVEVLSEGKSYRVDGVTFHTPVRHVHPVETYGLIFETRGHTFSWIVDTRAFPQLSRAYRGELLIMNVVRLKPGLDVDHLTVPDVKQVLLDIRPQAAILDHFGMTVWQAHPWEIARQLTEETGVRVTAARDGMRFDLATLNERG
jgi:phosphoribosyl 1,2-cyclic phosphodiesterase